nr:MAG TPA: hypothetical protein [Caudoviricetes sp.]
MSSSCSILALHFFSSIGMALIIIVYINRHTLFLIQARL